MGEGWSPGERMVEGLLREGRLIAPHEVPDLVARHARVIGATDAVIYIADLQQVRLMPVPGTAVPAREALAIEGTVAGWAFRTVSVLDVDAGGMRRVWFPLLDSMERLGVLELTVDRFDDVTSMRCGMLASLVAGLVVGKRGYGDTFTTLARTREMNLAAEIQNALLPPPTVGDGRVVVSGVVEPAYEVGGDVFDAALNGDDAHVAIIDAVGHDLQAGLVSSVAIGGFRNSRRAGGDLRAVTSAVEDALNREFATDRYATGVFAHVDVGTGHLSWANCGHPRPLLLRAGKMVKVLAVPSGLPLGLGYGLPQIGREALEPGDRVVFYTDGVVEARSPQGEPFGENRLVDFIVRHSAAGVLLPETLRRLIHAVLDRQAGRLQDDATILVLEWRGVEEEAASPVGVSVRLAGGTGC